MHTWRLILQCQASLMILHDPYDISIFSFSLGWGTKKLKSKVILLGFCDCKTTSGFFWKHFMAWSFSQAKRCELLRWKWEGVSLTAAGEVRKHLTVMSSAIRSSHSNVSFYLTSACCEKNSQVIRRPHKTQSRAKRWVWKNALGFGRNCTRAIK